MLQSFFVPLILHEIMKLLFTVVSEELTAPGEAAAALGPLHPHHGVRVSIISIDTEPLC